MRIPAKHIHQQLVSVLRAWGMSDAHAETTAEMMLETDLRGVDSHGISMLPTYDKEVRAGRINMAPSNPDRPSRPLSRPAQWSATSTVARTSPSRSSQAIGVLRR